MRAVPTLIRRAIRAARALDAAGEQPVKHEGAAALATALTASAVVFLAAGFWAVEHWSADTAEHLWQVAKALAVGMLLAALVIVIAQRAEAHHRAQRDADHAQHEQTRAELRELRETVNGLLAVDDAKIDDVTAELRRR